MIPLRLLLHRGAGICGRSIAPTPPACRKGTVRIAHRAVPSAMVRSSLSMELFLNLRPRNDVGEVDIHIRLVNMVA